MIAPVLTKIFLTTLTYGACGSMAAVVVRFLNRDKSELRLDHTAAVGFLVGASFGAFFGIFQSMLVRS